MCGVHLGRDVNVALVRELHNGQCVGGELRDDRQRHLDELCSSPRRIKLLLRHDTEGSGKVASCTTAAGDEEGKSHAVIDFREPSPLEVLQPQKEHNLACAKEESANTRRVCAVIDPLGNDLSHVPATRARDL